MMKTTVIGLFPQLNFKPCSIACLIIAMLFTPLTSQCADTKKMKRTQSFDSNWRFFAGEINGAEKPELNDSSWLRVNVPHDWSIEGLSQSESKVEDSLEFHVVKGEWKFNKGDSLVWKKSKLYG